MNNKINDSTNKKNRTIDALIIIDTETIQAKYGHSLDPKKPILVPNDPNLIYMINTSTRRGSAISGQTGNNLMISKSKYIQLRATSLSLNSDTEVVLCSYSGNKPLISNPEPILAQVKCPLPNPSDPYNPTTQTINSYFFKMAVNPGQAIYHFVFLIVDRHGAKIGYYQWDPFINITD